MSHTLIKQATGRRDSPGPPAGNNMTRLEAALLQKTDDAVYGAAEVPAAAAAPKTKKFIATVAAICLASAVAGYQAPAAVKSVSGAFARAVWPPGRLPSDKQCQDWAASGECGTNPHFMLHYCMYSCNLYSHTQKIELASNTKYCLAPESDEKVDFVISKSALIVEECEQGSVRLGFELINVYRDYYQIKYSGSSRQDLCVTMNNGYGSQINLYTCDEKGHSDTQWFKYKTHKDNKRFQNKIYSGLCLAVENSQVSPSTRVVAKDCYKDDDKYVQWTADLKKASDGGGGHSNLGTCHWGSGKLCGRSARDNGYHCEPGYFCNFDDFVGSCEYCYSDSNSCSYKGLPSSGVRDCEACCE